MNPNKYANNKIREPNKLMLLSAYKRQVIGDFLMNERIQAHWDVKDVMKKTDLTEKKVRDYEAGKWGGLSEAEAGNVFMAFGYGDLKKLLEKMEEKPAKIIPQSRANSNSSSDKPNLQDIGGAIKTLRGAADIKAKVIANLISVQEPFLSKLENKELITTTPEQYKKLEKLPPIFHCESLTEMVNFAKQVQPYVQNVGANKYKFSPPADENLEWLKKINGIIAERENIIEQAAIW